MAAHVPVVAISTEKGEGAPTTTKLDAYRRPVPLLVQYLLERHPLYKGLLKDGEPLLLRVSGDGREVARARHNLMVTVSLIQAARCEQY